MTGKKGGNLLFQHAERTVLIDRADIAHITLGAIHGFDHGKTSVASAVR